MFMPVADGMPVGVAKMLGKLEMSPLISGNNWSGPSGLLSMVICRISPLLDGPLKTLSST